MPFLCCSTFDELHFCSIQDSGNVQVLIENTDTSEEKLGMTIMHKIHVDNSLTSTTIKYNYIKNIYDKIQIVIRVLHKEKTMYGVFAVECCVKINKDKVLKDN